MTAAADAGAPPVDAPFQYLSLLESIESTAAALTARAREAGYAEAASLFGYAATFYQQATGAQRGWSRIEKLLEDGATVCRAAGDERLARIAENLARTVRISDDDAAWLPAARPGMEPLGFERGPGLPEIWLPVGAQPTAGSPAAGLLVSTYRRYDHVTLTISVADFANPGRAAFFGTAIWRTVTPAGKIPDHVPAILAILNDPDLPVLAMLARGAAPAG
jgi:hypothetical protein